MNSFTFNNPTRIHFGRGAISHLGEELERYGRKVLFLYGGGSIKKNGVYDAVMEQLTLAGAEVTELSGVQPNPRVSLVREGIALCREKQLEMVLAVGGGSVLDTGKAIVNGFYYDGDVWDLFCGKGANTQALPLGTVITIAAAGSEMSNSAVISNEETQTKAGRNTPLNFPKFSILDPTYTLSLPPYQTGCGIADIMAHMMERYFTQVTATELVDGMTESMLRTVIHNAGIVMAQPDNYDARAEIMWAGALAHCTLLGTGRVEDWASHKLEHELSALYDIPHGEGLAAVIPAWLTYCVRQGQAWRVAQFARNVFGVEAQEDQTAALEGIERLKNFYHSLGLRTSLREMGILNPDPEKMAAHAIQVLGRPLGNYVRLDAKAGGEVYRLCL